MMIKINLTSTTSIFNCINSIKTKIYTLTTHEMFDKYTNHNIIPKCFSHHVVVLFKCLVAETLGDNNL